MIKKCITCKKENQVDKYKPFCSKRCVDIDLYRWVNDSYAIPTEKIINTQSLEEAEY